MTWFSTALISAARAAALAAACVLAACSTPPADPRGGFATALARALPFAVGVYGVARSEPAAIGGLPPNADERGVSALPYARIGAGFLIDANGLLRKSGDPVSLDAKTFLTSPTPPK